VRQTKQVSLCIQTVLLDSTYTVRQTNQVSLYSDCLTGQYIYSETD